MTIGKCEKCGSTPKSPIGPWCRNCHVEMMPQLPAFKRRKKAWGRY